MKCYCKNRSYNLRLCEDYIKEPIRCSICRGSIHIHDIPLTGKLKIEILAWSEDFSKLLNNKINPEKILEFLQQHNTHEKRLKEKMRQELGGEYIVS